MTVPCGSCILLDLALKLILPDFCSMRRRRGHDHAVRATLGMAGARAQLAVELGLRTGARCVAMNVLAERASDPDAPGVVELDRALDHCHRGFRIPFGCGVHTLRLLQFNHAP